MSNININIDNYEVYALDYLENNLSPKLKKSFGYFLEFHPEIAEDLSGSMNYKLERVALTYDEKESLKHRPAGALRPILPFISIAASILLIALVIFLMTKPEQPGKDHYALDNPQQLTKPVIDKANQENIKEIILTEEKNERNVAFEPEKATENNKNTSSSESGNVTPESKPKSQTSVAKLNQVEKENTSPLTQSTRPIPEDEKQLNTDKGPVVTGHRGVEPAEKNPFNPSIPENDDKGRLTKPIAQTSNNTDLEVRELHQLPILEKTKSSPIVSTLKTESTRVSDLSTRIPQIVIPTEHDKNDEIIIASASTAPTKKKKFRLRNLIPEQFAGLTRDDIKESLLPEAITAR